MPGGRCGRHVLRFTSDGLRLPAVGAACCFPFRCWPAPLSLCLSALSPAAVTRWPPPPQDLLVNARHIPFGVTVRDLVGARAASLLGCHIMNDESVVFGLSQKTPEQRKAAYWLCGLGVALIWPLGTLLGAGVGKLLPAPETIGLDAVFPAILLALVVPAFKKRTTLIRACSGAVISLAAVPFAPVGLPVLLSLFGLLARKK